MSKNKKLKLKKIFSSSLGLSLGFPYAFWAYGKNTGEIGRLPNIRIMVNAHEIFPHHWLVYPLIALAIYITFKKANRLNYLVYFVMFFLIGAALQGFWYKDWWILFK